MFTAVSLADRSIQIAMLMLMKPKVKGASEYETPVKNAIGPRAYAWFE